MTNQMITTVLPRGAANAACTHERRIELALVRDVYGARARARCGFVSSASCVCCARPCMRVVLMHTPLQRNRSLEIVSDCADV